NPAGIGDINSGGANPIPGHERADGGDDESLTFGNNSHPGPSHKFPPSREDSKNKSKAGQNGSTTVPQEPTKNVNSTEVTTSVADPVFSYPDPADPSKRTNTRKVTGRNTPSAVDAVFNFRNFWDGRAQNVCNGANPFGARDNSSHLLVVDGSGKLAPAHV